MAFNKFNTWLVIRVLLLNLVAIAAAYLYIEKSYAYTPAVLLVIEFVMVAELVHYLKRTQRKVTRFFESALFHDFNFTFATAEKDTDLKELHQALSDIEESIEELRFYRDTVFVKR